MTRREELMKCIGNADENEKMLLIPLVDDVVFMEEQLDELRKLPFIMTNPKNPSQQRTTPASKQYKELLQQYSNVIKIMCKAVGNGEGEEDSPLRAYMKMRSGEKC